jgi:hypothetical protein
VFYGIPLYKLSNKFLPNFKVMHKIFAVAAASFIFIMSLKRFRWSRESVKDEVVELLYSKIANSASTVVLSVTQNWDKECS